MKKIIKHYPMTDQLIVRRGYICARGINFEIISTVFDQTLELFRQSYVLCFILFYIPFCHYHCEKVYIFWPRSDALYSVQDGISQNLKMVNSYNFVFV